jgi:hypothetical protein
VNNRDETLTAVVITMKKLYHNSILNGNQDRLKYRLRYNVVVKIA